jgi:filamentous hemagglutinin
MGKAESSNSGTRTTQNASVIQGSDIYVNSHDGSVNLSGSRMTATDDLLLSATKGISPFLPDVTHHTMRAAAAAKRWERWEEMVTAPRQATVMKNNSREDNSLENGLRSQLSSKNGSLIAQAGNDLPCQVRTSVPVNRSHSVVKTYSWM